MDAGRIAYLFAFFSLLPSALAADPLPENNDSQPPGPEFVRQDSRVFTGQDGLTFEIVTRTDALGRRQVTVEPIAIGTAALPIDGEAPLPEMESASAVADPATDRWLNLGPDGGAVLDVNASPLDPQLLLAGLDTPITYSVRPSGAIYRSTDGGSTWSPSLMLPIASASKAIHDIEFSPEGVAYAGGDQGVFRSTDGGASWTRIRATFYPNSVLDVAIEPGDSRRIWIGLDSQGSAPRVQRSIDGGATWQTINVPLATPLDCRSIAFDPARPGRVYAAFGEYPSGQIWLSLDGGASWTNRSATLPGSPLNKVVIVGTSVMVAAGEWSYGAQYGGLYLSDSDTGYWRAINSWPTAPFGEVVEDFAVDPTDGCTIWAATPKGLFRTTNCGLTWTVDNLPHRVTPHSVRVIAGPVPRVLAGTESYAVMKREGNGSFQYSSRGIRELNVVSVSANPLDPDELAAAFNSWNSGGIYASLDGGQSWTLEPALSSRIATVDFAPDGTLYAISDGPSDLATEGVYHRTADGQWAAYGPHRGPWFETELHALCFDPHQPGLVVAAGNDWLGSGGALIYRSTDGGMSWSEVYRGSEYGSIYDLAIAGATGARAMLAGLRGWNTGTGAVLRSIDQGGSWTRPTSGGPPAISWPYGFAVSPRDPNLVYFSNYFYTPGLFRSRDAGLTWQSAGYNGNLREIALHPDDDREIFAVGYYSPNELMRSRDGGAIFQGFADGMSPIPIAQDLFAQAGDCPRIYAATTTGVHARIVDRAPPHLQVSLDHEYLWPPDHELIPIRAVVEASDACDPNPSWRLLSITSDEAVGGTDPDVTDAEPGAPDDAFQLRAAREGYGDGRTYTIVYEASDASGNSVTDTAQVVAPHDQSGLPPGVTIAGARAAGDIASAPPRLIPSANGGGASLRFDLARPDRVRIDVFDLLGARVRTLLDEIRSEGGHEVAWDGRDAAGRVVSSGLYLVRLRTRELRWSGKAVVVR